VSSSRRGLFRAAAEAAARAAANAASERMPEQPEPEPVHILSDSEIERYSRQLLVDGFGEAEQVRLGDASTMVIGAGALGSPVAAYLAGAGVGRIGVIDDDTVEVSNLHRQHLHYTPDVGHPKVQSAVAKLQFLNPEVMIEPYQVRVTDETVDGLVAGQDVVVDCSDSFETRYLVNAACCRAGIPLVEAGVVGVSGLVMSVRPGRTACYRCAFPEPPPPGAVPTCAEAGVLGPAAGVVGSLQAMEALRQLAGLEPTLLDAFLQVDLTTNTFLRVTTRRRPGCPACG
jgi:adenylyltransferase/sulfurtransferase